MIILLNYWEKKRASKLEVADNQSSEQFWGKVCD